MTRQKTLFQVFDPWQRDEPLIQPYDPSSLCQHVQCGPYQDMHKQRLSKRLASCKKSLTQLEWFVEHQTKLIRLLADNNIIDFLEYLACPSFASNAFDQHLSCNKQMSKYNGLAQLLVICQKRAQRQRFLTWLAQELFLTCFDSPYNATFLSMLKKPRYHSLIRFIYTSLWLYLGQHQWASWHANCLSELAEQEHNGKKIIYLAGGTDIYIPLTHNIHNLHIIDPFLPTQYPYYSRGWRFLLGDPPRTMLGDTISGRYNHHTLTLKRTASTQKNSFILSDKFGKKHTLPHLITQWHLWHATVHCGTLIFERRPVVTADFMDRDSTFIASFNELYFIASPKHGWSIRVSKLPEDLTVHVKQLRKPIGKETLIALKKADSSPFSFIQLGSCVT